MRHLKIRPLALRDISQIAEYLEKQSGPELSDRFVNSLENEFEQLLKMPDLGSPCHFQHVEAQNIRRWPVDGFERWLIFYESKNGSIEVVRVLHGARNIAEILD